MRAYVRLDPFLPDNKADAANGDDYPDGAGWAFILTLCWAAHQSRPGRFHNRKVLAALLGKRRRWIGFLIEHGDIVQEEDGSLYVEGWKEWQEGQFPSVQARQEAIDGRTKPLSAAERARRYRERKKAEKAQESADPAHESGESRHDPAPLLDEIEQKSAVSSHETAASSRAPDVAGGTKRSESAARQTGSAHEAGQNASDTAGDSRKSDHEKKAERDEPKRGNVTKRNEPSRDGQQNATRDAPPGRHTSRERHASRDGAPGLDRDSVVGVGQGLGQGQGQRDSEGYLDPQGSESARATPGTASSLRQTNGIDVDAEAIDRARRTLADPGTSPALREAAIAQLNHLGAALEPDPDEPLDFGEAPA